MAWQFNGTTDYATLANAPALSLPDANWTVAGWVNWLDAAGTGYDYPVSWSTYANNPSFNLVLPEASCGTSARRPIFVLGDDDTTDITLMSTPGLPSVTWKHICLAREGTTFRVRVDNVVWASGSNSSIGSATVADALYFGGLSTLVFNRMFSGIMAEWAKWDRALSDSELAQLAAGKTPDWFADSLAWYLPMRKDPVELVRNIPVKMIGATGGRPPAIFQAVADKLGRASPGGDGMIGFHVRTRSYTELVRKRAKDATFRNLTHAASTLRITARRSLRKRKETVGPGPAAFEPDRPASSVDSLRRRPASRLRRHWSVPQPHRPRRSGTRARWPRPKRNLRPQALHGPRFRENPSTPGPYVGRLRPIEGNQPHGNSSRLSMCDVLRARRAPAPNLLENVKDAKFNLEKTEADVTTRKSNGWEQVVGVLKARQRGVRADLGYRGCRVRLFSQRLAQRSSRGDENSRRRRWPRPGRRLQCHQHRPR